MPRMSKSEKLLKQQEELELRRAQEWGEFKVDYHKRLMFLVYEFSSRKFLAFNVNRLKLSFNFSAYQAYKMYGYPFSRREVLLPFDLHDYDLSDGSKLMNDMLELESMVEYLVSVEEEAERKASLRSKALNKLSQEEREALNLLEY